MIKIGMMIGERYEILEKIGTGGMSDVYKAKCHKLNRFVAVKVLKQEFSENANFVSKFRVEAQAAAGLMHPNIVNVYDVGEENGIYYIVMELVDGITLKKYVEKKARLSYKEAISIAIQVSMGIEAAHNNHIIHRDIKPQNIIISKEGKVKVTDFGIAKAATSNTITSNVMGSVHYTSPEQARGGYSDEKSDIYSLGITLFEMLTGRVPYNGETTVAIAIKHIQEELPSPREFVAEIPTSVEQIVFKCCQKSPDRRYQSMAELIQDLKQSLLNPDEDFVKITDPDEEASTRMISETEMDQIKRQSDRRDHMDESLRLRKESFHEEEYDENEDEDEDEDFDDEYDPKMEKVTTVLAIIAGVLICGIILFLVARIFGVFNFNTPEEEEEVIENQIEDVTMIAVIGKDIETVRRDLIALGLNPVVNYEESDEVEAGIVMAADVYAGTVIQTNTTVTLTVSSGTNGKEVPSVTGLSYEAAAKALDDAGFVVNKTESYSADVESGNVISQNPEAGSKAPSGSAVSVRVSLGQEDNKIRIPNVIGLSEMDATVSLIEAGASVGSITQVFSNEVQEGYICYQSYSEGSYVDRDTRVDLRVSMGAQAVTYRYSGNITAPTQEEDPEYKAGITVNVIIKADNGTELLNTRTSDFPFSVNYTGIQSASGTIEFIYTVTTEGVTTTDPETGEITTTPGTSTDKKVVRPITFTQE